MVLSVGSVSKVTTGSGVRWRARYRTPDGRSTDRRFKTRAEASAFLARVETDKQTGVFTPYAAGRVRVGDLASVWLDSKRASSAPSHYRTLESAWRNHVGPVWAGYPLSGVVAADVQSWLDRMVAAGSGQTVVRRAYGVLLGILDDAVRDRRLPSNPASAARLPRRAPAKHVYLTAREVHRLAEASGDYKPLVLVLAFCGLRWAEAVALTAGDIDPDRGRISVHRSAVQLGARWEVGPPKGGKARSVPIPGFVLDTLELGDRGAPVFPRPDGGYLRRPKTNGWLRRATVAEGLPPLTPHALRHTYASLAVGSGASVLAVSRAMGHADPSITLRIYADLFDTDLDLVGAAMDERYSPDAVVETWVRNPDGSLGRLVE